MKMLIRDMHFDPHRQLEHDNNKTTTQKTTKQLKLLTNPNKKHHTVATFDTSLSRKP